MRIRINRAKDRIEIDFQTGDGKFFDDGIPGGAAFAPAPAEVFKLKTAVGLPAGSIEVDKDGFVRRIQIQGVAAGIRVIQDMVAEQ